MVVYDKQAGYSIYYYQFSDTSIQVQFSGFMVFYLIYFCQVNLVDENKLSLVYFFSIKISSYTWLFSSMRYWFDN